MEKHVSSMKPISWRELPSLKCPKTDWCFHDEAKCLPRGTLLRLSQLRGLRETQT